MKIKKSSKKKHTESHLITTACHLKKALKISYVYVLLAKTEQKEQIKIRTFLFLN